MSLLYKNYKQCYSGDDEEELFEVKEDFCIPRHVEERSIFKSFTKQIFIWCSIVLVLIGAAVTAVVIFVFLPDIWISGDSPRSANSVVQTRCGTFVGVEESGSFVFKGVPYARPPVGALRWKKPFPLWQNSSWCDARRRFQATSFASKCFQMNPFLKQLEGQEDCLFLNIWTPTLDPQAKLEVMVWIHSGFLQFGSGHEEGLRPNGGLASHLNVVFVSFNFRLHAFGYLALEALATGLDQDSRGNYGTWDQLLLLEWVQQNIHSFGGDPDKVTAFGPDGGAASILSLMARNAPFRSAWLLGPALLFNRTFLDASHHSGSHFTEKSGCGLDVSCLRNLTPKEVIRSYIWNDDPTFRIRDQNDLPIQGILPEQLMVVDGEILPFSPIEAALHKNIKDIPLLIGTSAQAVDFWPGPDDLHSWTWTQYRKYVTTSLDSFDPQANGRVSLRSLQIYNSSLQNLGEQLTPELVYTTMVSDIRQTCPINHFTELYSAISTSPVFRYIVTSRPSAPVRVSNYPGIYSSHLWEAVAFFNQLHRYIEFPTDEDFAFRDTVQRTVLEFVKTAGNQVKPEEWLTYPTSVALLNSNITLVNSYHKTKCKFWSSHGLTDYAWVS